MFFGPKYVKGPPFFILQNYIPADVIALSSWNELSMVCIKVKNEMKNGLYKKV